MRKYSDKVVDKIETHIFSLTSSRKSWRLRDNIEKYGAGRKATNDNVAHTRCMLDKQGYTCARMCAFPRTRTPTPTHTRARTHLRKHPRARTHRKICNTDCFSMATVVSRKRLCYVIRTVHVMFVATNEGIVIISDEEKSCYALFMWTLLRWRNVLNLQFQIKFGRVRNLAF
jgi:hypothetical protein